ncbi:hypothetical protein HHI36_015147 [Cryptolaemus montrouzieri]|uniref:Sulfotransferase domain-containing protein n=1 Tax=Cryptolaemus montrouzieri TaxID=559131 RepID=A0ABD2N5K2_9CUCU
MLEADEVSSIFRKYESEKDEFKREFPFEIKKLEDSINKKLLKDFTGERTGFLQVGKHKWFFPSEFKKQAAEFYNFEVRSSDVWIVTFPRSGTTLTQEMVWLLANNLDYRKAAQIPLTVRYPFLEFSCFIHPETKSEFLEENKHSKLHCELIEEIAEPICTYLNHLKEKRFIKTHLPLNLLPKNLLTAGCKNLKDTIIKVQDFLGTNHSEKEIEILADHLHIDNFRNNSSVNFDILKNLGILIDGDGGFVRRGKSGDWKNYFDTDLNKKADEWIEENLKNTDFRFPSI